MINQNSEKIKNRTQKKEEKALILVHYIVFFFLNISITAKPVKIPSHDTGKNEVPVSVSKGLGVSYDGVIVVSLEVVEVLFVVVKMP